MASLPGVAGGHPLPYGEVSVFLHPLPRDYSAADLRRAAHRAGILTITDAWIPRRQLGQPYGYLRFGCREDAVAALDALQQLDVGTRPAAMLGRPKTRRPVRHASGSPPPGADAGIFPSGEGWGLPLTPWSCGGWDPMVAPWAEALLGVPTDPTPTAALGDDLCPDASGVTPQLPHSLPWSYTPLLGAAGYPVPAAALGGGRAGSWEANGPVHAPSPGAPPVWRRPGAAPRSRPRSAPPHGRCAGSSLALPRPGVPHDPSGDHLLRPDPVPAPVGPTDGGAAVAPDACACPAEREWWFLGLTISAVPREGDSRRLLAGILAATREVARGYHI